MGGQHPLASTKRGHGAAGNAVFGDGAYRVTGRVGNRERETCMPGKSAAGGTSPSKFLLQAGLVIAAFALWDNPVVQPVKLLVVLLHEMSHGLMALATGGSIEDIVITPNEGGACKTLGGNALLIVSSGYLGSMFFGGILLTSSRTRGSAVAVYAMLGFLLLGTAFTVLEDQYSRRFALSVAASSILIGAFAPGIVASLLLRAVGTVSCLYALVDIYNDLLSENSSGGLQSDAVAFAKITGVAPASVGMGWLVVSVFFFLITLRTSLVDDEDGGASNKATGARL